VNLWLKLLHKRDLMVKMTAEAWSYG